jgi:DNA-binding beta-propeller fold protein YncE
LGNKGVELKQPNLVVPVLAFALILSLLGCSETSSNGVFGSIWGTEGSGDGEFQYPNGVAVASDGSVYVADHFNNRIQKFTSEGVFVSKWGTEGRDSGSFHRPSGVAVASDGSVYVVDGYNCRIQKFLPGK